MGYKTEMNSSAVTLSFLMKSARAIALFGSTVFLVRYLGADSYGQFAEFMVIVSALSVGLSIGISDSSSIAVAEKKVTMLQGLVVSSVLAFLLSVLGTVVFYHWTLSFIAQHPAENFVFTIGFLLLFGTILRDFVAGVARGYHLFFLSNFLTSGTVVLRFLVLLVVVLFVFQDMDYKSILIMDGLVFLFIGVTVSVILLVRAIALDRQKRKKDGDGLTKAFLRVVGTSILWLPYYFPMTLLPFSDRLVVSSMMSSTELGVYDVAVKLGAFAWVLIESIQVVLLPSVASLSRQHRKAIVNKALFIVFFAGFMFLGISAIIGNWGVQFLFGEKFQDAFVPFLLCICSQTALGVQRIVSTLFLVERDIKQLAIQTWFGLIMIIALTWFLIPNFGIVGAALASLMSSVVLGGRSLFLYLRYTSTSFRSFLEQCFYENGRYFFSVLSARIKAVF